MRTNYNIERKKLHLPEYGRHIQDMVEELMSIENRDDRNLRAKALVAIMANIQHASSEMPDFERKLWDHLFIMSDFQLDVDSPFPKPTATTIMPPPHRMEYPKGGIVMKHYGRNVKNTIRALERIKDGDTVDEVIYNLARYMRTKSFEYNQEHPDNAVIIRDIRKMANYDIPVDEEAISLMKSEYRSDHLGYQKKSAYQKKGAKSQKTTRKVTHTK
ncbi:MAG: DUF4290 domain-containing protein [Tidjanibacter sp.]|nr:DUF4290 domain-containing protein [Tidjanibacter sp.]